MDVLSKYARRQVPRYTSYPTAPHMNPEIGGAEYSDWLGRLDSRSPVSLYFHVPFCKQVCWYCGCNMKLARRYEPVADYVESLMAEIDLVAGHLPGRMAISHLHWGGGTPTTLAADDLARVMDRVQARFDVQPGSEIALEADPRSLTDEMISCAGRVGFTRASFGVQEFDADVQRAINRIQPPDMVRRAVDGFRAAGVPAINFDLIYGLPYQSEKALNTTVEIAAGMEPDRFALFGYAHVPWKFKRQRKIPDEVLPDADERLRQANSATLRLQEVGYQAIGLDHFASPGDALAIAARDGTMRRNFQGYTTDQAPALLGLGATAIGHSPLGYVQNISETGAWARAIAAGQLPVARGYRLTRDDCLRGGIIEAIMCQGRADLPGLSRANGRDPAWLEPQRAALDEMEEDGLIRQERGAIELTALGRRYSRNVAAVFDAFLSPEAQGYSMAV